jgi:hypothetical protein
MKGNLDILVLKKRNMKKIMCLVACVIFANITQAQDFYVKPGGSVTIKPTAFIFAGAEVKVEGSGTLTAESDGTDSSSLLAVSSTATGNITYKRFIDDTNWHLVSAPVTSQNIATFVGSHGSGNQNANSLAESNNDRALAWYDNTQPKGSKWQYYKITETGDNENSQGGFNTGNFKSGLGYSTLRTAAGNYTFTGEMSIGTNQGVPFGGTTTGTDNYNWTPVGNPYPSFLPLNELSGTSSVFGDNVSLLQTDHAALYLWDGNTYIPFNYAINTGSQLAPGQAFMAKGLPTLGSFVFTKAAQTIQNSPSDNFRGSETTPAITVNLTSGAKSSDTKLMFFDNTTRGKDIGYDAGVYKIQEPNFLLSSHLILDSNDVDMYIQCLPASDYEANEIPLSVKAAVNETLIFTAEASNLPMGINVYIRDEVAGITKKINGESYEVSLNATQNGIGRFYLYTNSSVLAVEESKFSTNLNLYKRGNNTIRVTGFTEVNSTTLTMYTITGKEVFTTNFTSQRVNDVAIPNLAAGIYLVQVLSNKGKFTKKLIIE